MTRQQFIEKWAVSPEVEKDLDELLQQSVAKERLKYQNLLDEIEQNYDSKTVQKILQAGVDNKNFKGNGKKK